jgi:hypothetical protein
MTGRATVLVLLGEHRQWDLFVKTISGPYSGKRNEMYLETPWVRYYGAIQAKGTRGIEYNEVVLWGTWDEVFTVHEHRMIMSQCRPIAPASDSARESAEESPTRDPSKG